MIELHGDATGNCFRVAIALEEAELRHRYCKVGLTHLEQRSAPYLRLNPTGRVPTIVDLDATDERPLVLTQSNAIMLYLADKSGKLLPGGAAPRARALEWLLFFVTDVIAPAHQSFFLRRSFPGDGSAEAARRLDDRAMSMYRHVEDNLADRQFMAGDSFSLADIAGYTITAAFSEHIPWDALPKLRTWFETVKARPAVIRGMAAFR